LTHGQYNAITLAQELEAQLNALGAGTFRAIYNAATGRISLSLADSSLSIFRFWNRLPSRPYDALEVIGLDTDGLAILNDTTTVFPHNCQVAGTRVLYLTSSNFGHYNSLGPRGESDILRAIYVDAPQGSYISDRLANPWEHIEVGGQQLQSLRFKLTDGLGQVVDMKGQSIAFSIIFLLK
jgi:hypothetical protein